MRKWKDDLVPVLLEMMQDSTAAVKREVCFLQTKMAFFVSLSYMLLVSKGIRVRQVLCSQKVTFGVAV